MEKCCSVITVTQPLSSDPVENGPCVPLLCVCVCVSASVCLVHWVPGDTVNVCVSERTKQWACFKPAGQWGRIRPG